MSENPFQRQEFCINLEKDPSVEVVLITHGPPLHADDLLSIDIIAKEATKKWCEKNVNSAGVIELDIPGSKFSDKNGLSGKGSKDKAMCVKVAESLGISDDSRWKKILEYINRDDLRAGSDQTSIASLLKQGQMQYPHKYMEVCEWFMRGLAAKAALNNGSKNFNLDYVGNLLFANKNSIEFSAEVWLEHGRAIRRRHRAYFAIANRQITQNKIRILKFSVSHQGKEIRIAALESDNYRMQAALRAKRLDGSRLADLVIIKGKSGVLINHVKDVEFKMREVAAALRFMEAKKNNIPAENHWRDLRRPGTVDFAPVWFFNTASDPEMIMNSLPHDAPSSALSLEEIARCAVIALDEKSFHPRPDIAKICQSGKCPLGAKCPNLQMRLPRCMENFMKGGRK